LDKWFKDFRTAISMPYLSKQFFGKKKTGGHGRHKKLFSLLIKALTPWQ